MNNFALGYVILSYVCASGVLMAQPPARQSLTCATCHPAQARTQPQTPMGIGIEVAPDQALLASHPKLTFESNGYKYTVERQNNVSTYSVTDGKDTLTLPIHYAFGVHTETFVLEYNGQFYESLVSYYARPNGLDITMGDERAPRTLVEAMGRELPSAETNRCFGCHATEAVVDNKLNLAAMKPGLTCGHCHTDAAAHLHALVQGQSGPIPKRLGKMSAEETSNFCGGCHRSWETVVRDRMWGPANVRFQPFRLAHSKCFNGLDSRISCVACHDPHQQLVRDSAGYDGKCLACHKGPASHAEKSKNGAAPACPAGKQNCAGCHMPKVELPGGNSVFTDHFIRVVHPGEPYND